MLQSTLQFLCFLMGMPSSSMYFNVLTTAREKSNYWKRVSGHENEGYLNQCSTIQGETCQCRYRATHNIGRYR